MEPAIVERLSHKTWRRQAKKERRRRIRTSQARARDADAERLDAKLKETSEYLNWLEFQRAEEERRDKEEAREHEIREREWLEEELRAQKEWRIQQERKAKARQVQLDQETRIRKEYEAKQEVLRLKKEEARRKEEEESERLEEVHRNIEAYIDEGRSTPEVLREVTNSQPGKEPCPFFSKTGACRYGDTCSRNHQRLALSRVLLIPGFYSHFSLEKNSAEYDTDIALEFGGSETRHHFREFYNDVVPELETFGRIKTLKCCRNTEIHLRGNMYVEYYEERAAARALRSLKGRWYAGRQLNCEFANVQSWRNAICGMPKCPKGRSCNFLHTFRNPRDEYDVKSPQRSRTRRGSSHHDQRTASARSSRPDQESARGSSWMREESSRNWRWSDSSDSGGETPTRASRAEEKRLRSPRKRPRDEKSRVKQSKKKRTRGDRTEKECERNGKSRDTTEKRKDRSKEKDSAKRTERSKWDGKNYESMDTESESGYSDSGISRRRRRKVSRRSRSRSWSQDQPTEVSASEGNERSSKTPHR
ncbi:U2 small nuclear ribonucleoprotein auxiliary factor 35 kDa subunit-related protein 2 [Neodiprion pinetum]|uniref:U2 small nuclear ribonucleoprotein auxiliary factor 35 kDa subunit-related protein 2 n=1 Tax=Neodiprion pinetum TaxID=441929 RepID=UPI001EDE0288|nr:U2 small nuclear ribonucleoprotein auxiliary factor 35 kDa subunit-related protein 2 [Neodiprion pinetum]